MAKDLDITVTCVSCNTRHVVNLALSQTTLSGMMARLHNKHSLTSLLQIVSY